MKIIAILIILCVVSNAAESNAHSKVKKADQAVPVGNCASIIKYYLDEAGVYKKAAEDAESEVQRITAQIANPGSASSQVTASQIQEEQQEELTSRCSDHIDFIESLVEHTNALKIVGRLRALYPAQSAVAFVQMKQVSNELNAYNHILDKNSIKALSEISKSYGLSQDNSSQVSVLLDDLEAYINDAVWQAELREFKSSEETVIWLANSADQLSLLQEGGNANQLQQALLYSQQDVSTYWGYFQDTINTISQYSQNCQTSGNNSNLIQEQVFQEQPQNNLFMNPNAPKREIFRNTN